MDFGFDETQLAVREAATTVLGGMVSPGRVGEIEATEDRVDRELWAALAEADLLGLAVPASEGGGGFGLTELCLVLEGQGQIVAPVPLWSTLVLGAHPIARYGSDAQRARWLPGVVAGEVFLTGAFASATTTAGNLAVAARPDQGGWILDGVERGVPQAHLAARIVVPARTGDGKVVLALVDPGAPGVRLERAVTTNREIHPHLFLESVAVGPDEILTEDDGEALALTLQAAWTGLCAIQVGVCEQALKETAAYLNQRQQFGRSLSTFQGALLRAGDAAIDLEAMRVTLWQAAWRLDTGREAAEAVAVAKWQASERGQRIIHSTQHLHGGLGADITYPIHRYFFWGKQIELLLGGPSNQLARLGGLIRERFVAETNKGAA